MDTDERLVMLFQRDGDVGRLDELTRRHMPRTRAVVFQMVLNDADADDLVQEIFVRAYRGLGTFRGSATFTTWLYRIVLNTTRSFLAARGRRSPVENETAADPPDAAHRRPDARALDTEKWERIEAAMGQLSPKLRAALTLVVLQDMPAPEAAGIEGCSTATMYWRVYQARKELGRSLAAYLET
ncbi:MAG: hypothetical protein A3K18_24335 [Lentisphaerae bacterium RIFOXYA12_64_32]|nr:MAG: hypothetical protein A3K18_24335 [Lentisphaerae bacterium RIFOXYA12_64_32]